MCSYVTHGIICSFVQLACILDNVLKEIVIEFVFHGELIVDMQHGHIVFVQFKPFCIVRFLDVHLGDSHVLELVSGQQPGGVTNLCQARLHLHFEVMTQCAFIVRE